MSLISWLAKRNPQLRGSWPSPQVPGIPNPNEENTQEEARLCAAANKAIEETVIGDSAESCATGNHD